MSSGQFGFYNRVTENTIELKRYSTTLGGTQLISLLDGVYHDLREYD